MKTCLGLTEDKVEKLVTKDKVTKKFFGGTKTVKIRLFDKKYNNTMILAAMTDLVSSGFCTEQELSDIKNGTSRSNEIHAEINKILQNNEEEKAKENKVAKVKTKNDVIGSAVFKKEGVSTKGFNKLNVAKNKNTLYVFPGNLQARNATHELLIGETMEVEENGRKKLYLNTKDGNYEAARTNHNGDVAENTVEIPVKKNLQNQKGKMLTLNDEGYFFDAQDESDIESFRLAIEAACNEIAEKLKDKKYKEIVFPESIQFNSAKLANIFMEILAEKLDVVTYSEIQNNGKLYTVKFSSVSKKNAQEVLNVLRKEGTLADSDIKERMSLLDEEGSQKKDPNRLDRQLSVAMKAAIDAVNAMNRLNPMQNLIVEQAKSKNILDAAFPNIMVRLNRVNYVSLSFSENIDFYLKAKKEELKKLIDSGNASEEDLLLYRDLTDKDEKKSRLALLAIETSDGTMVDTIIMDIKSDIEKIANASEEDIYNDLIGYSENSRFNTNFYDENKHLTEQERMNVAKLKATHIKTQFTIMKNEDVFPALIDEAAMEIAFNENVDIDVINRDDAKNEDNERLQEELDLQQEDQEENANKEGYMIKYRLMDPILTLSLKVKKLLGLCYYLNPNTKDSLMYDDICTPLRMDSATAFAILHEELGKMTGPEDFVKCVDAAIAKYPWLSEIRDYIVKNEENSELFDEDTANAFYRTFRSNYEAYGYITPKGRLKILNANNESDSLLGNATDNYESRIVLSNLSIYNGDGTLNINNTKTLDNLFRASSKENVFVNHYFAFVLNKLRLYHEKGITKDVIDSLQILKGINKSLNNALTNKNGKETQSISLKEVLNAIGIDANKINLDGILLDDETLLSLEGNDFSTTELDNIFPRDNAKKIVKVLESIQQIVNLNPNNNERLLLGDHITSKFQSKYVAIGSALGKVLTGYTALTFRDPEGKTRASYIPPSFISDLTTIVSDTETEESILRGTEFLKKHFLQYDFYAGNYLKTGNINDIPFLWLRELMDPKDDYAKRRSFKHINLLAYLGEEKQNLIGKMNVQTRLQGYIYAYAVANRDEADRETAWYRTIPVSDVDAAVHFRGPRYSFESSKYYTVNGELKTGKLIVIEEVSKVLEAEIKRIIHYRKLKKKGNYIKIENLLDGKKDNGTKFNLFPELNELIDDIIKIYLEGVKAEISEDGQIKVTEGEVGSKLENSKNFLKLIAEDLLQDGYERFIKQNIDMLTSDEVVFTINDAIKGSTDISDDEFGAQFDLNLESDSEPDFGDLESDTLIDASLDSDKIDPNIDGPQFLNEEELIGQSEQKPAKQILEEKLDENQKTFLEEFFYNDFLALLQITPMMTGDPALYKNFDDLVKRNKQAYAAGQRIFAATRNADGTITRMTLRAIYIEDEEVVSTTWQQLQSMIDNNPRLSQYERDMYRGFLLQFGKICSTDGQSFRSPHSFRKILKAMGDMWTDSMELSYLNLINGNFTLQDFMNLWDPIKPFVYTSTKVNMDGRIEKVSTQHKNSEYLMTSFFSLLQTAFSLSVKHRALARFMEAHDVDVVHFHSVVKDGFFESFDLNFDKQKFLSVFNLDPNADINSAYIKWHEDLFEKLKAKKITQKEYNKEHNRFLFDSKQRKDSSFEELVDAAVLLLESLLQEMKERAKQTGNEDNNTAIKVFDMNDYALMQPSKDHLTDSEAITGSQGASIITADLSDSFSMEVLLRSNEKSRVLNKEDTKYLYNALKVDMMLEAFKAIGSEYSDIKRLQKMLLRKIKNNPQYGPDVEAALQLDPTESQFMIPFNSPNLSNKIDALIMSVFKNEIQRMKISGGNAVLVSNYGLSNDLKVVYDEQKSADGKTVVKRVKYIEAYIPMWSKEFVEDFVEPDEKTGYLKINLEKMRLVMGEKLAEKILRMIGYRIPTESKYSMFPIKIKGFLPATAGGTIILPADIITMSGTDFDIDKLFLMIREFRREVANKKDVRLAFERYLKQQGKTLLAYKNKDGKYGIYRDGKVVEVEQSEVNESSLVEIPKYLRSRFNGITIQELDEMVKDETFSSFMDENIDLYYETAKYSVLEPDTRTKNGKEMSLDEISLQKDIRDKRLRRSIRNNMLIDLYEGILISEEGSSLMMRMGNFERPRFASRVNKILNNKAAFEKFIEENKESIKKNGFDATIKKYTVKLLEDFYDKYSEVNNPFTITELLIKMQNLMDGNDLIGITALGTTSHYKLQDCNVRLSKRFQFSINGIPISQIDSIFSPLTGEIISNILAEYQAAAPDNGKDPCLGDIGMNASSASFFIFLARLGVEPLYASMLHKLISYGNLGEKIFQVKRAIMKDNYSLNNFNLDYNELFNAIVNIKQGKPLTQILMNIADFALTIWALASMYDESSSVLRADTTNGSLETNAADALQRLLSISDFYFMAKLNSCPFIGLDKVIDDSIAYNDDDVRERIINSQIPRVLAAYTLGVDGGLSLSQRWIPYIDKKLIDALRILETQSLRSLKYKKQSLVVRAFIDDFTTYLLSSVPILDDNSDTDAIDKHNYYVYAFPMKYRDFIEKHPEIASLDVIKKITCKDKDGIKFFNIGKIHKLQRIKYVKEIASLLQSSDEEIRRFGVDLFMYCYSFNGLRFARNSFSILFGSDFLLSIPEFCEVLSLRNIDIKQGKIDFNDFVELFQLNHPEYIKRLGKRDLETAELHLKDGIIVLNNIQSFMNNGQTILLIKFGKNDEIYRLTELDELNYRAVYEKCQYNKTKSVFYSMRYKANEILYDSLLGNGPVVSEKLFDSALKVLSKDVKRLSDPKKAHFYTGDATGADALWSYYAKKYGIKVELFSPKDYEKQSAEKKEKIEDLYRLVVEYLGESVSPATEDTGKLFRRNMLQVSNGDAVFAVAPIENGVVLGGTRYAVYRGVLDRIKPVYVFDINPKSPTVNLWMVWDHITLRFVPLGKEPMLTQNATVVGSRDKTLTDEGRNAIKSIVENSIKGVTSKKDIRNEPKEDSKNDKSVTPKIQGTAVALGRIDYEGDFKANKADEVTSDTEMEAIVKGEKTALTKTSTNERTFSFWSRFKPGQIIQLHDGKGRIIHVRLTGDRNKPALVKLTLPGSNNNANTTLVKQEESTIKPTVDIEFRMTYSYGNLKANGVTADTTFEAIKRGERTATTRYVKDGHIDTWANLKVGDIITFKNAKGEKLFVRITKQLTKLTENTSASEWSKKEGWSEDRFEQRVLPQIKGQGAYQIEFEYIGSENKQQTPKVINVRSNTAYSDLSNFSRRPFSIKDSSLFLEVSNLIDDKIVENGRKPFNLYETLIDKGLTEFESVEAAFQGMKVFFLKGKIDYKALKQIKDLTGYTARKAGRDLDLDVSSWDEVSYMFLETFMEESFLLNPEAAQRLVDTGDATIIHRRDETSNRDEDTRFSPILTRIREKLKGVYGQTEYAEREIDAEQWAKENGLSEKYFAEKIAPLIDEGTAYQMNFEFMKELSKKEEEKESQDIVTAVVEDNDKKEDDNNNNDNNDDLNNDGEQDYMQGKFTIVMQGGTFIELPASRVKEFVRKNLNNITAVFAQEETLDQAKKQLKEEVKTLDKYSDIKDKLCF